MSNKKWCPGCDGYTSTLQTAWDQGAPCPYCDLGPNAWREVIEARQRYRDSELRTKYEKLLIDHDRLVTELLEANQKISRIKMNL